MMWRVLISRKLCRTWPLLLSTILLLFMILLIWSTNRRRDGDYDDDYVSLRLTGDQKDYIDGRGIHVVVGHYVGDSVDPEKAKNLSKEIINKNMFDPRPFAGRNGEGVLISTKDFPLMQQLFQINRFNLMASDRIPLNRSLPDYRRKQCLRRYRNLGKLPNTSVIIVFHNEAWSTLLRTVYSVINRSPRHLLAEILLVDDDSDREFLKKSLDEYVKNLPVPIRILRADKRVGLVNARLIGAREAKGNVLTFLDAHCECTVGWLEPLLEAISKNPTRVIAPVIDNIHDDTFAYKRSLDLHWAAFNWDLHFRWLTLTGPLLTERRKNMIEPFKTPAMAGGLFSMDKEYFFKLGSYDEQMKIWGGENIELSLRVWQCGGTIEIAPCSHVGHLFRKSSPHTFPEGVVEVLYGNLARVALVWMDEWAEFYFKFHPEAASLRDKQQVRSRLELRKDLKCQNFEWYLDNIWPNHFFPKDDRFFGKIVHIPNGKCVMRPATQSTYAQESGYVLYEPCIEPPDLDQMFIMTETGIIAIDESLCLDAPDHDTLQEKPRVKIMACSGLQKQLWRFDEKIRALFHISSGMCLEADSNSETGPVIAACNGNADQQWKLESVPWK